MRQKITNTFESNDQDCPTGGMSEGIGITIGWQNGPLNREKGRQQANGAFVEGVIQAAIDRLYYFQNSKFRCRENAIAITKLEEALHWLDHRTLDRENRGVEGTYNV